MSKQTVSNEYVSAFCLEMSLLLHAGIGIEDGLYLLIEDEKDKKSKKMLEQLADLVTEGKPFSEAVREVGMFPKYVGDMIETGEETGRLEQSFQALADYYDRQQQLMSQIRSALLYPFILMVLMLVILVVLLVKVLPIFNQVYEQLLATIRSLDEEKEHMLAVEKSKTVFLRSASHELKTPLSGLRILLENMQYNIGKYKDRDKYLAEAVAKVDELSGMVRDILDTSKVQDLQEEEKQKLYADGEIGAVLQEYAMQIADKKLEVTDSIPEDCMLFMSRNAFQKVWSNLIGNAVQYTEQGGQITIAADTDKIWIENSCTPLTEEQLAYIYEPFYRVDDTRAASGGNGLGLYVVRELLKKEGFRYVFEPVEDGMRFTIFL